VRRIGVGNNGSRGQEERKMRESALGVVAAAAICAVAGAQVDPIGPFTGGVLEGFETQCPCPPTFPCVPGGVFDGQGTLCADQGFIARSHPCTACTTTPRDGNWFFGNTGRPIEGAMFTFSRPVHRFGGYFAANHGNEAEIWTTFLDEQGVQIARLGERFPGDCSWNWFGWESRVPIRTIHVLGARIVPPFSATAEFQMDDMRIAADTPCYPDCDDNGVLDFFDFLCFQNAFLAGDPYADCDGNGTLDFFDFLCFQNAFLAGCP
jgi:hypothetical protein